MRSWYEFGYNGFPTGEQRRRFYRQRDDPCDSEEERDYDDETNDRPIFYYPLRESEQGSGSSDDSASASGSSASSSMSRTSEDDEARLQRRRQRCSRRCAHTEPSMPCTLHSTLYEDMPAWYGSSSVPFTAATGATSHNVTYSFQYGGAPCATPFAVSNQASLWRWSATSSAPFGSHSGSNSTTNRAQDEAPGSLTCTRVEDDASLLASLHWDALHPSLRLGRTSSTRPLPRIGHCAASLATLDTAVLLCFLTTRPPTASAATSTRPGSGGGNGAAVFCSDAKRNADCLPVAIDSDVEVHASLVIGGASQLIDGSSSSSRSGGSACHHHGRLSTSSYSSYMDRSSEEVRVGCATATTTASHAGLHRSLIPAACTLLHPMLCLTLLESTPVAPAELPRHHTVFFPLDTPSMSILAPRAFATLTPWADHTSAATGVCSFAFLGGTENGRDPLPFLELEVVRLHLDTWTWSTTPVATYGTRPAPRFGHSANVVEDDACFLLFGGVGTGHVYLNDLHVLDLRTKVWREVFIPFGLDMPCRAFHTSAVWVAAAVCSSSRRSAGGVPAQGPASAFTERVRALLESGESCGGEQQLCDIWSGSVGGAADAGRARQETELRRHDGQDLGRDDREEDGGDVWSAHVTSGHSRGTLFLLGGESDSGPVSSSWACTLRNGLWRRHAFPLRTQPPFFHVARSSCSQWDATTPHTRRLLSRADYRAAVDSLADRARGMTAASRRSGQAADPYMAVCHGSLAQVIPVLRPGGAEAGTECLLVVGGSHSPPVSVVTQVSPIGTSLKDIASLQLLAAHEAAPLSATLLGRVPRLDSFCFHNNGGLARAMRFAFYAERPSKERPQASSDADARSHRHAQESVLDGQLMDWMRLARKRLRDAE